MRNGVGNLVKSLGQCGEYQDQQNITPDVMFWFMKTAVRVRAKLFAALAYPRPVQLQRTQ